MKYGIRSIATMLLGMTSAASFAQTWDLSATTQSISGQVYDSTGTSALVVTDDKLYYLDWELSTVPPALELGPAKQIYRYPVSWYEGDSETYFLGGGSPTGSPVTVTLSVDAAVYQLTGPNFEGMVVGLLLTYEIKSGSETEAIEIFEPGVTTSDKSEAKQLLKLLATGEAPPTDNGTGGEPSCVQQCKNTYDTEKQNALDRYTTNVKTFCGVIGLPAGFVGGCTIGTSICGWIVPPASTVACCLAGGIIGSGLGFGGCVYGFTQTYQSELRIAERNYHNCLRNCGVIIAEH